MHIILTLFLLEKRITHKRDRLANCTWNEHGSHEKRGEIKNSPQAAMLTNGKHIKP